MDSVTEEQRIQILTHDSQSLAEAVEISVPKLGTHFFFWQSTRRSLCVNYQHFFFEEKIDPIFDPYIYKFETLILR